MKNHKDVCPKVMGMRENKLVVLGAGGVGKTSLVVQYLEGFFSTTYKPTVEDYYRHTIQTPDGIFHSGEILDTAGSHNFPAMRELSIRSGRGFILVFALDSLQSFHEAFQLFDAILKLRGSKVPIVLVGNKADLKDDRQVSKQMIEDALKDRVCRYIETSAKYNVNVAQLFVELLEHAKELEKPPPQPHQSRRLSRRLSSLGNITVRRKSSLPKLVVDRPPSDDAKCIIA